MKQYELDIIAADKTVRFSVMEPETKEEKSVGLSFLDSLPEKTGMIYFSLDKDYPGYPCMEPRMCTRDTKFPVDFLFIDSSGNIRKIDKNVPALSAEIHTDINVVGVLELNAGDCDKYGIEVGDCVIHKRFRILPGNKIIFHDIEFERITERTLSRINPEDIVFFAYAEGGAMGWAGSIQIVTKRDDKLGLYFIDYSSFSDFKPIEELFPPITKSFLFIIGDKTAVPEWTVANMHFGNHLFIRKEYREHFDRELDGRHIYRNWIDTALKILKKS